MQLPSSLDRVLWESAYCQISTFLTLAHIAASWNLLVVLILYTSPEDLKNAGGNVVLLVDFYRDFEIWPCQDNQILLQLVLICQFDWTELRQPLTIVPFLLGRWFRVD
jgi:hypothetical protein